MRSIKTQIRLIALLLTIIAGALTASAAKAQRPDSRPYFAGYTGYGYLIGIAGRSVDFYPESEGASHGAWLISGTGGDDRIVVYDTNAFHVRAATGWRIKGTYQSLNSLSWLGVDVTDSSGKLIKTDFIPKWKVRYIAIDAQKGDDIVRVSTDIDCWIETGDGDDLAVGGDGNDYIENTRGPGDIQGRGGNDVLVGNVPDIYGKPSGGVFAPCTFMYGGVGTDTYIFNFQDWLEDTINGDRINYSWNGGITPADLIHATGRYNGMSQITMDDDFLFEYAVDDFGPSY